MTYEEQVMLALERPHGDLIDRDELINLIRTANKSPVGDTYPGMTWGEIGEIEIMDLIRFPVVIPGNRE